MRRRLRLSASCQLRCLPSRFTTRRPISFLPMVRPKKASWRKKNDRLNNVVYNEKKEKEMKNLPMNIYLVAEALELKNACAGCAIDDSTAVSMRNAIRRLPIT